MSFFERFKSKKGPEMPKQKEAKEEVIWKDLVKFPEHAPYYIKHKDWDPNFNWLYTYFNGKCVIKRLLKIGTLDPKDLCFVKDGYVLGQIQDGYGWGYGEVKVCVAQHLDNILRTVKD